MITITIQEDQRHFICGFTSVGHAEYDEEGYDIVCAGVSAVTQTALVGLLHFQEDAVVYEVKKGRLAVSLKVVSEKSNVILETMVLGLEEMARQYPGYVVLNR
jgi:uncharacterized protein YsxB (DUF464 family)